MNSTNVPSKNKKGTSTITVVGSQMYIGENELVIPEGFTTVNETITAYVEEQGNIEIPVGNSKVNENGILEMENGTTLAMKNQDAYKTLSKQNGKRNEMKGKASNKMQVGVDR